MGRYQDRLGQWNTDRSFQYSVGRDQVSDSRYADETAWNRDKYSEKLEYDRAMERAKTLAAAGDFSGYKALGYTDQEVANLKAAYDREQSLKAYVGRKSGDPVKEPESLEENYAGLFQAANQARSPANYIASHYKEFGFTSATGLSALYKDWAENGGFTPKWSQEGETLLGQLKVIPGLTAENKVAMVNDAFENGRISEDDVKLILEYLGYGG